ncbi:hypothetical protein S7711_04052 [Stachybotrys chartarum IBT 7711]|uniref:non-specific serine/threonine protein kinase n=1 Tax=Stachybotrys chartarum (strain CBS 109288 / IBT 7711) TaxID=1280523 RepID=A0A084AXK8_STACB|nr:hypothetical protein S7711_04052 [Stachybotrys chartarum IBT 7711]
MASYGHHAVPQAVPGHGHHPAAYAPPGVVAPGSSAPHGTFSPGTKIQVGGHRVVILKYLSEGGFAHVYLVKLSKPVDGTDQAVLKRVAVPDKESLRGMRTEVETMKRLKGHRPIVTYIDSHASELRGGGYEVFLLMEFCNGGGLIDFMNTRLQHRLTEPEILNIFADIAEGVACMHYLKPALLHRDLKVENVLITSRGSNKRFKLCDFGSAAPPRPAPTTVVECRLMDEDVQKHTTLQYRSPEMVDVYRKQPINEKSDIWALGVLLYKLCYYTTPFEDQGQLAILNASFKYPSYPVFSTRLKALIASMLKENMQSRPTIYQALKEACAMLGREVPIQDIYATQNRTNQDSRGRAQPQDAKSPPAAVVGAVFAKPEDEKPSIPDVVPMRRGRPGISPGPPKPAAQQPASTPKVTKGDPFAALDSKAAPNLDADEISTRFPSLDQFSLLHDKGSRFDFETSPVSSSPQPPSDLSHRITARLADEAFASPVLSPEAVPIPRPQTVAPISSRAGVMSPPSEPLLSKVPSTKSDVSRAQSIISSNPELKAIASAPASKYVSTGTMTTDSPPEGPVRQSHAAQLPRSSSLSKDADKFASSQRQPAEIRTSTTPAHVKQPSLSRLSLDDQRPRLDALDPSSRSANLSNRTRPTSSAFESNTLDYLRDRESSSRGQSRPGRPSPRDSPRISSPSLNPVTDDDNLAGLGEPSYFRGAEDLESRGQDKGKSSKRSSLTSLSGTKNILAGKFGDAFKRFETHGSSANQGVARTPSPLKELDRRDLTPIAGSEATDDRTDDGHDQDDEKDLSPEMRREMERRKLLDEERRVEAAQAEYRRRMADGGPNTGAMPLPKSIGGVPRAVSIQNRVQNLLSEDARPPSVQRMAQGYGKYSDAATAASKVEKPAPEIPRKPLTVAKTRAGPPLPGRGPAAASGSQLTGTASAPPTLPPKPVGKPAAPRKPVHLNSLPTGNSLNSPAKQSQTIVSERLVAADLPGQPILEMSAQQRDDYIEDFSKRFPSLGSIEMVEREIGREPDARR